MNAAEVVQPLFDVQMTCSNIQKRLSIALHELKCIDFN